MLDVKAYSTLVFDCDGVILNSNPIKTEAFYEIGLSYGETAAKQLVDFHKKHGGVSRYKKFEFFLKNVIGCEPDSYSVSRLADFYANKIKSGVLTCEVSAALYPLRELTVSARWLVVSGSDGEELNQLFKTRDLAPLFDGGIYGSPDDKHTILRREIARHGIVRPALFIGDSRCDYEAARAAGLDFVFLSEWTGFSGWQDLQREEAFFSAYNLAALIEGKIQCPK